MWPVVIHGSDPVGTVVSEDDDAVLVPTVDDAYSDWMCTVRRGCIEAYGG